MSESNEPSYYEIALTGRQVTTAFVLVLTSLLVAFFSGVWIGRGSPRVAVTALAEAPPANPTPNELSFFAEPAPPPPTPPASGPTPVTPVTVAPTGDNPSTALAQDRAPDQDPRPIEPAPTAPSAVVAPPPAPVATPPAATPPVTAAPAPAPSGPLVIQVFTSSNEAKAKDMWQKLKAKGFKAYLSPTKTNGKTVYRVRVGPFQKEADAKVVDERIRKQFKVTTWITRSA